MDRFELLGPLPGQPSTTVIEASAGTGKTYTLSSLVTRYIAEGRATLDQMLLITFTRAASQELRERVRSALIQALRALENPDDATETAFLRHLTAGSPEELTARRARLRDAVAEFDAATIATIHQFCGLVLKSLGIAGDTDIGLQLVESLDDLLTEVVDDLYLAHFGQEREVPALSRGDALTMARGVVANPGVQLRPDGAQPGSGAAIRVAFANDVLAELEKRKRKLGVLGYDDLLSRLAGALESPNSPAAVRMRQRWSVVMVDEFQDTDPVQWQVIERAFGAHSTVILIGDPKQAIYGFRGGDIVAYLDAARSAADRRTLGENWRTDSVLLDRLQVVLQETELGDSDIVVREVEARHRGHRLVGAPRNDPFRLRVVSPESCGVVGPQSIKMDVLRPHVARDLAADVRSLLASQATFSGNPLQARDIAVLVENGHDGQCCYDALIEAGIPAVYTGDGDVLKSKAAGDWLTLLEAFDQLHRPAMVRAAATTMFFGETAESLALGGDGLTDRVAETLRQWADHARESGVAAIYEVARLAGMGRRVLGWAGGERNMTDLAHVAELLHDLAHRERYSLTALRDWLRTQCETRNAAPERSRRLDSDAAAVQIMTVWGSKGLQFPVVYLPFMFNKYVDDKGTIRFHDESRRCLHIGGPGSADLAAAKQQARVEQAGEEARVAYVALTRAQSQLVTWWAPSWNESTGSLSRLLRGRRPGETTIPESCVPKRVDHADAMTALREWEAAGGPTLEESVVAAVPRLPEKELRKDLGVRHFHRAIDTAWRRTSYSGLVRFAESGGVGSEPDVAGLDDENDEHSERGEPAAAEAIDTGAAVASPMAEMPVGADFGSLVHAVLETADPSAVDLAAELRVHVEQHSKWWPLAPGRSAADVAAALVPLHDTPLGPLARGLTLRRIGLNDRLREMEFEFPLAGGDLGNGSDIRLADVGELLRRHLPADDRLASYSARLSGAALGSQSLRGYLSGSVDAVLRIPVASGHRYLVVDYKTNWLGDRETPLTAADYGPARMAEAMLHSDYPLQALLYSVVLHRFLRWRQPGYDPDRHLAGVLYLFLRGMCGERTPVLDGHPSGVFGWRPPPALVVEMSDLLDGRRRS